MSAAGRIASGMPGVELNGVSKVYERGRRAVDHVTLRVEEGELLVLVGPSGCGKSTVLRMVAGLEEITEGEIRIGDRVVNEVPPRDRDIAMVFQNYALYPHLSVFENLAFGLRRRRVPAADIDRRVRGAAETLGLTVHLARRPRELSGGERQRVALGRAMVREPRVFLFDEPLSNLDAQLRVQVRGEIKRLHQRLPATMIYVTHDQVEAMTLGDRIAVLRAGVLQQHADPGTLYRRPANAFVAAFIGSPPINLFTATVGGSEPRTLEAGGHALALPAVLGARLAPHAGRTLRVGLRPEDLATAEEGAPGTVPGQVEVREPLGNETLLYWQTPFGSLISRLPGDGGLPPGGRAALRPAFDHLLFFDPESGRALD